MEEEINWLIICSDSRGPGPLVEVFGGSWPEDDLWTEEFIPGETLDHAVDRLARKHEEDPERLESWWPFAAWAALSAYIDFWDRTGRTTGRRGPVTGQCHRAPPRLPLRRATGLHLGACSVRFAAHHAA